MSDFGNRKVPVRFLAAFSFGSPRAIRDLLDDSLAWKLLRRAKKGDTRAVEELEFIARFNEEFYRGYFRDGRGSDTALHKTAELTRKMHDTVNARRKDVWGATHHRLPLSITDYYPNRPAISYSPDPADDLILEAIEGKDLTRKEIMASTGLKKGVVYPRIKVLQTAGLVRQLKRQKKTDILRFVSTKSAS